MIGKLSAVFTILMLIVGVQANAVPPPPRANGPLIDDLSYRDAAALQAAWRTTDGSAPASVVKLGNRLALRMPCKFGGTQAKRASWDRAVSLDMAACRGIRFDLYCADPSPVAFFTIHMHSSGGWYTASFAPSSRSGWTSVVVDKADTRAEDSPAGWTHIDAVRFSAWRGGDADTEFYVSNLSLEGADAPILVIRDETASKSLPNEAASVAAYTKNVADALDRLGLSYAVISDQDVTADRLKGKLIVVLPHNPQMPDAVVDELTKYVGDGGKLLAFYTMPVKLAEATGIGNCSYLKAAYPGNFAGIRPADGGLPGLPPSIGQVSPNITHVVPLAGKSRVVATWFTDKGESANEPAIVVSSNCAFMTHVLLKDDPVAKRTMLLAMLGYLDERLWKSAVDGSLQRVGKFGRFADLREVARGIRSLGKGNNAALDAIAHAESLRRDAVKMAAANEYPEAMETLGEAQETALSAYCMAQRPKAGEHRAWWCHSPFGVAGMSWDQAVKNLADNGFNALMVNMAWGGTAYYDSKVLPVAAEVKDRGDQLAECLAACRKYGLQCNVWKVCWNMGTLTPNDFQERMRREERTQVGYDGKPETQWLCPSNPANQQLEIDAMTEVATKYDIDGIHFDYIRYPDADHCYCAGCRARFEAEIGAKVANWPADTRNDPVMREKWLAFRRENITKVVAAVHEAVKRAKPKVLVSAAVFTNWSTARDSVAQDWKVWCDRGYLDFACPMDYTPSALEFETTVERQRSWAGKVPCYPGIGLSVWGGDPDVAELIEQIDITRRLGTGGFTIFNYSSQEASRIIPLCGSGITRRE
jgi:uncharacterized lipoprotein YddW (UPF0748 family)